MRSAFAGLRGLTATTLAVGLTLGITLVASGPTAVPHALAASSRTGRSPRAQGPFVTIMFSRTEVGAANDCTTDNSNVAPLLTTVAPYLRSLGLTATGTLETGKMQTSEPFCTHYNETLSASWNDASILASFYNWRFGSATATYPVRKIGHLPPKKAYAETCGSAAAIDAHHLPGGHGYIAYPGLASVPTSLQADYGDKCFAWGRQYGGDGTTQESAGTTPPYWQNTTSVNGGSCNMRAEPCYHTRPGTPNGKLPRYVMPSTIIARIEALRPGQWLTFQNYILVTGTNPRYTGNTTKWDCNASDPRLHWTNDNERYCYNDWQKIVQAIAADPNITVTDPLTVGEDFGRPNSYQSPQHA
jgi:hypothetical protein